MPCTHCLGDIRLSSSREDDACLKGLPLVDEYPRGMDMDPTGYPAAAVMVGILPSIDR